MTQPKKAGREVEREGPVWRQPGLSERQRGRDGSSAVNKNMPGDSTEDKK